MSSNTTLSVKVVSAVLGEVQQSAAWLDEVGKIRTLQNSTIRASAPFFN